MSGFNLPPGVTADMIPGNESPRTRVRNGSHSWVGPTAVIKYTHCERCEEIRRIDPAKPNSVICRGTKGHPMNNSPVAAHKEQK